jgi:hypothetical protein
LSASDIEHYTTHMLGYWNKPEETAQALRGLGVFGRPRRRLTGRVPAGDRAEQGAVQERRRAGHAEFRLAQRAAERVQG